MEAVKAIREGVAGAIRVGVADTIRVEKFGRQQKEEEEEFAAFGSRT